MIRSRRRNVRSEEGAVAVIVALIVVSLIIVAALVVDIAQGRLDRQASKSAADSAVMAGLRSADGGGSDVYTKRAVCGALSFLRSNDDALAGLPDSFCTGSWITDNTICDPSNPASSVFDYNQTITSGGVVYAVQIKSPYLTTEGSFAEESYGSLSSDTSTRNGCDQVAVIVDKTRDMLFGRVISDADLHTRIRSVGRVHVNNGDTAPALLLLEQVTCNVLQVGSGGAPSSIKVLGSGTTPGSIHADTGATDSAGCAAANDKRVFQGNQMDGIVAYGGSDGSAGLITSYAGSRGVPAGTISDGLTNVHGTTAVNEASAGTSTAPAGRSLVTRRPVDARYRTGVVSALSGASSRWTLVPSSIPAGPVPGGWAKVGCSVTQTALDALGLTAADKLYVDCAVPAGISLANGSSALVINAGEVFFNGFIKSGSLLSMPNASRVYINNTSSSGGTVSSAGLSVSNNNAFCVRATACDPANTTVGACSTGAMSTSAKLFVRQGTLNQSGGLLRLCNTTVYLMGGRTDGCVPSSNGTAPTSTPCSGGLGNGQLKVNGGSQDWTAPNEYASAIPEANQATAWAGGEDLALWAESAASPSNKFTMGGGGSMKVAGVYMTPNAKPFQLNGGASQTLANAQFIASTFEVGGNSNLTMTVDPNNAVTLPRLDKFTLVR